MNYIREFCLLNFPLLCIVIGMAFVIIFDYKGKRRFSNYILIILTVAMILAIFLELEEVFKSTMNVWGATICGIIGYAVRPLTLYLFIRLASDGGNKKERFLLIVLGLNLLVYCSSLFIPTDFSKIAFYYAPNEEGTALVHVHGTLRLNYTSHFVSAIMLGYLIYKSMRKLKNKHNTDALAILTCAFFVVVAVLVGTFTSHNGLLNNTIGVSCVFYYMFMNNQASRRDQLTGLFERKSFYDDEKRFSKSVTSIIQIDMNGLKMINDNQGHDEGDKALKTIGQIIGEHLSPLMYGYRIGGDEFIVVAYGDNEEFIKNYIQKVRDDMAKTPYSCSIGYVMRNEEYSTFTKMMKASELQMYIDKDNYYKNSKIDRRRK